MDSTSVSVVVQGPTGPYLEDVLSSVRRYLPGAELILSTWAGSVAADIDVDVLVESQDPGSINARQANGALRHTLWNTNRMLRSTKAGIARVTRPMTLKLRSDTPLRGDDLLSWWSVGGARADRMRVFEERVITLSIATRPSDIMANFLFHPSDCVHFGLTRDVALLWSAPEIDETANATYWLAKPHDPTSQPRPFAEQYWNEQVVWLGALAAAGCKVDYPYSGYIADGVQAQSDLAISNNFVVLEPWQAGVAIPKLNQLVRLSRLDSYLHNEEWWRLRAQHCPAA